MTYEQLADDAYTHIKTMFAHFGLAYSDQTQTVHRHALRTEER